MSNIITELTPVYYRLHHLRMYRGEGSNIVVAGKIVIYNEEGDQIAVDNPAITATQAEKTAILAMAQRGLGLYEGLTGLEVIPPELLDQEP